MHFYNHYFLFGASAHHLFPDWDVNTFFMELSPRLHGWMEYHYGELASKWTINWHCQCIFPGSGLLSRLIYKNGISCVNRKCSNIKLHKVRKEKKEWWNCRRKKLKHKVKIGSLYQNIILIIPHCYCINTHVHTQKNCLSERQELNQFATGTDMLSQPDSREVRDPL